MHQYVEFLDLLCLMPLSAIFQLYHADQFWWRKKPEYPERTTDHGQATGKLYHLQLRVECTLFCNLQSWARTHAVLVIGLHELLGNPTLSHPSPLRLPDTYTSSLYLFRFPPLVCLVVTRKLKVTQLFNPTLILHTHL